MKKLDIICIIIGVICFLLAGYIVYIKFFKENKIDFNEEEEIKLLDDKLAKIGTPLGWLIITDGIDHQNEDGTKYNISYGTNLLKEYSNRQLFTMEYILSTKNENDKFILLSGFDNNKIEGEPTDDYTLAYLDYDTFNKYYKDLFGEDFDLNKQDKGNLGQMLSYSHELQTGMTFKGGKKGNDFYNLSFGLVIFYTYKNAFKKKIPSNHQQGGDFGIGKYRYPRRCFC